MPHKIALTRIELPSQIVTISVSGYAQSARKGIATVAGTASEANAARMIMLINADHNSVVRSQEKKPPNEN